MKNATLQELHGRAKQLIAQLDWFAIDHALREHNREADELANQAMDSKSMDKGTEDMPTASSAIPRGPWSANAGGDSPARTTTAERNSEGVVGTRRHQNC